MLENGFHSYGTGDYSTYQATGYDTDDAGTKQGTASGSTTFSSADGTAAVVANVPAISTAPIKYTSVSGWFLNSGSNALPGGITLVENTTTTTAYFTDGLGRTWNLSGVLDADGHNVDITFTVSGVGTWTQKFDANAFAPTELAAASTSASTARAAYSAVRPMWGWGDTAAVAGAVAGVAGAVAAVAVFVPGGQGVAAGAAVVAGVSGAVAGVSAAVDHFQHAKKK